MTEQEALAMAREAGCNCAAEAHVLTTVRTINFGTVPPTDTETPVWCIHHADRCRLRLRNHAMWN